MRDGKYRRSGQWIDGCGGPLACGCAEVQSRYPGERLPPGRCDMTVVWKSTGFNVHFFSSG